MNLQPTAYNLQPSGGFTFIELLIVIGVVVLLAAAVSPLYTNLQIGSQLNESTSAIVQNTRLARERSASRLNGEQHGVFFEINAGSKDRVILYQGPAYATRFSEYDRILTLDNTLSVSTILSGSGDPDDINFSLGRGIPDKTGTVRLVHESGGTKDILLNAFGLVEED